MYERVEFVKVDIERHPNQDQWGYATFWVLLTPNLEALTGEYNTDEWNTAFDFVAKRVKETFNYTLYPYSGGPGRGFRSAPSFRVDEWDGDPAFVVTSRFGMDV